MFSYIHIGNLPDRIFAPYNDMQNQLLEPLATLGRLRTLFRKSINDIYCRNAKRRLAIRHPQLSRMPRCIAATQGTGVARRARRSTVFAGASAVRGQFAVVPHRDRRGGPHPPARYVAGGLRRRRGAGGRRSAPPGRSGLYPNQIAGGRVGRLARCRRRNFQRRELAQQGLRRTGRIATPHAIAVGAGSQGAAGRQRRCGGAGCAPLR